MAIVEEHEMHETRTGSNGKSTATIPRREEHATYMEGQAEPQGMFKASAGGSMVASLLGIGAIVLAILVLAKLYPNFMLHIGVIAVGVALLLESSAVASRFTGIMTGWSRSGLFNAVGMGGGLGIGFMAGVAGIVLGILALIGYQPAILIPSAIIALGSSLVLGSGFTARLDAMALEATGEHPHLRDLGYETIAAAFGMKSLMGLGAIVLGILALLGFHTMILSLVATLALSFTFFATGSMAGLSTMSYAGKQNPKD